MNIGKFRLNKLSSIVALSLLVILSLVFILYFVVLRPPTGSAQVKVVVQKGSTLDDVASLLVQKRIVRDARMFLLLANYRGVKGILAGNYDLRQGMAPSEALNVLARGPVITQYVVVVPEGFSIRQIAQCLSSNTKIDVDEFRGMAQNGAHSDSFKDYTFLKENTTATLEGYLFPKTYTVSEKTSAKELIQMMLDQFAQETAGLDFSAVQQQRDLARHQILTIASLIEAEAKIAEERPLIAAVIYNRLNKNMRLQIDATVQYALPERKPVLTAQDLKVDSLYNTYLHAGLPPGPICSPGFASIQAALNPAPVNYLYYVLTEPSGKHSFTDSYEEFLRQKQRAKQSQ